MKTYTKSHRMFFLIIAFDFLSAVSLGELRNQEVSARYEGTITVAARALKDLYEPNEPVPLVVAIANHSSEPVYRFTEKPGIFATSSLVTDANGMRVMGDPVIEPPPPDPSHYMEKDGRMVYVVPVSKIEGPGLLVSLIPDALSRHHKRLSEGTYHLDPGRVTIIHKVSDLIVREDVPHKLWIDPRSPMTKRIYKANTVKIEIRKKPEVEKSAFQAYPLAWSTFLTGTIVGIVVLCLILLLKKVIGTQ